MALDRRELTGDPVTAFLAALEGNQAGIWTALPAQVLSFNPVVRTAELQVTVQAQVLSPQGTMSWVSLPPLVDCPVVYPGGKDLYLTFPLVPGDEVLVLFASRCIDNWWQQGGVQTQAEFRMHSLSDGFCLPGPRSVPVASAAAPVAMDALEIRNKEGTTKIRLLDNGDIKLMTPGALEAEAANISAVASVQAEITAPIINLTGNVIIEGTLTVNGRDFMTHVHSGVTEGSESTGGVV